MVIVFDGCAASPLHLLLTIRWISSQQMPSYKGVVGLPTDHHGDLDRLDKRTWVSKPKGKMADFLRETNPRGGEEEENGNRGKKDREEVGKGGGWDWF